MPPATAQIIAALGRSLRPRHADPASAPGDMRDVPAAGSRWTQISGPLFTLTTAVAIELLSHTIFYIPVPHAVMLTAVMYAAFSGGMRSGFVSILIMMAYTLYYFALPDQPLHYTSESVRRILVLLITSPAMVIVAGLLKRRTELLAQARVARVRAEAALALADAERALLQESNARLNAQVAERTRVLAEKVEELAWANAELQKLDQMRAEFLALVSHQIRAPLTNIRGAVEHMQLRTAAAHDYTRDFAVLTQQVELIDRLIQKVLNAARIEAAAFQLEPEPVSVLPMLQQAVSHVRVHAPGRVIQLPPADALPFVCADRMWIVEVLVNLLDNALKYAPAELPIAIEAAADQRELRLAVRDQGPGLPEADIERVFAKFYRVDSGDAQVAYGYGLGLFICRRLIEAHHGRIWAANDPRGGAVITFTLPIAR